MDANPRGLTTRRLALRRFAPDDADALFALDADPAVMRWITGGAGTPREEIENRILPLFVTCHTTQPGLGWWAVARHDDPRLIGWIGLNPDAGPDSAELGYRLARRVWGRGFATEAARRCIGHAFEHTGTNRIVANTYQDNAASRRVMQRIGMRFERAYRLETLASVTAHSNPGAELWDGLDVRYVLTRTAWQRQMRRSAPLR